MLAAKWNGYENVASCEIDAFCNRVLKYHFPNSMILDPQSPARTRYEALSSKQAATRRLLYIWVMFAYVVEDAKRHESIKLTAPNTWKQLCELHNILNAKKAALLKGLPVDLLNAVIKEMGIDEIKDLITVFDQVCDGDIKVIEVEEEKVTA